MQKAITFVGNSSALILDRTICEVIGVGVGSIVSITFEGRRLVIEPTGKMKLAPPRRRYSSGPRLRSRRTIKSIADTRRPVWSPDRDETGEIPVHILARENSQVVEELTRHWGLNEARIAALDYQPFTTFTTAFTRLHNLFASKSEKDIAVARRLRFVFEELEDYDDWDRVIALAVARYPLDSNDNMSAGIGASAVTLPPSG
jgi:antitoxin component of MazEF toxin-antitoxin module